jgi:hypothetical protein
MLKTVITSEAKKTKGLAVTYRSGKSNVYGTCPSTCPLNPTDTHITDTIDMKYLNALLKAIPRKGKAFTYTHFKIEDIKNKILLRKIKYDLDTATINRSTDTLDQAIEIKRKNIPTTVTLADTPIKKKSFTYKGIDFVRCIAEYNEKFSCINCRWCSVKHRTFIVVFYAHGAKKKLVGTDTKGGCYGSTGRVRLHWERTKNTDTKNEIETLNNFTKQLPTGTILRHHIVGDIGERQ